MTPSFIGNIYIRIISYIGEERIHISQLLIGSHHTVYITWAWGEAGEARAGVGAGAEAAWRRSRTRSGQQARLQGALLV